MDNSKYIGCAGQIYGVEEHRLIGGKGDGMRLFEVRNGLGLEFTVSADRCADISRLSFKGDNMGYFAACGYVGPQYYEREDLGFLKSFTGGFLTTCGLTAVGAPCVDEGEELPLHGTISNTPADKVWWSIDDRNITLHAVVNEGSLFGRKLQLERKIECSRIENKITLSDTVTNLGSSVSPLMLLYHVNIGYPLLSEKAILSIPSKTVNARNVHAAKDIDTWNVILPPTKDFEEQCYYHTFEKEGLARIYNPDIHKGIEIAFDPTTLDYFTEWKMMGEKDYVLGLEPGNCHPEGRDKMRAGGKLKFLAPDEGKTFTTEFRFQEEK
jgi:galactose mutarotase-like enzyme